jgi:putative transcriptional regulator
MDKKEISQRKLSKATNIRLATVNALYNEYAKRVNFEDLSKICEYLDCKLSDIAEYVPDKK